jgi:hypothetical protein
MSESVRPPVNCRHSARIADPSERSCMVMVQPC